VLATRPPAGLHHPLDVAAVRAVLHALGPVASYGLRSVELTVPPGRGGLALGRLVVPGRVLLYAQPHPPWVLPGRLRPDDRDRLEAAGAVVTDGAGRVVVDWPGDSLRDLFALDVLPHELAHHALQHERTRAAVRGMRTRDHEAAAETLAARWRRALA
jgi:hypothetical protein